MNIRRWIVGAVVGALLLGAAPAHASGGLSGPEPWKPFRSEPVSAPAGKYCDFPLKAEIVEDDEEVRVLQRYPDGTVKADEFRGALIVDFVNVDTGKRARRDLSGRGWAEYRQDESWKSFTGVGPFGSGFRDGDGFPRGYYVLDGVHRIDYAADGTKDMPVMIGSQENVCGAID